MCCRVSRLLEVRFIERHDVMDNSLLVLNNLETIRLCVRRMRWFRLSMLVVSIGLGLFAILLGTVAPIPLNSALAWFLCHLYQQSLCDMAGSSMRVLSHIYDSSSPCEERELLGAELNHAKKILGYSVRFLDDKG